MCIDCGQVEVNILHQIGLRFSVQPCHASPRDSVRRQGVYFCLQTWIQIVDMLYSSLEVPFSLRLSLCVVRSTPGQKTSADFKWGFIFRIKTLALFLFFLRSAVYRPQNPFVLNRMFSITSLFFEYGLYILSTLSWLYFVCIELTTLSWIYQALQRITSRAT